MNKILTGLLLLLSITISAQNGVWTVEKANQWYKRQPWIRKDGTPFSEKEIETIKQVTEKN
ncbi:hypothetical protein [Sphingobacterium sp. SGR-19]|uniref:hypothetical protein n=1 Tax=Sphingobacterium sp. SGR-19 TaxID=2710886 RepID=UPI0013EBF37E|nr:hypothetical protein [Sphingobacterium sp. SGR-19]NGM65534.1 hypothetical protein [Sphingobacterium sp. SGR-19]